MANRTTRQQYKRKLESIETSLRNEMNRIADVGVTYQVAKPELSHNCLMIYEALEALANAVKQMNEAL